MSKIQWYELQANCYECSGGIEYCRTLDDVADILAFEDWQVWKPIRVRTLVNGLPKTIDQIGWNYSELGDADIDYYISAPQEDEEVLAYSYNDDEREMVIFIFLPKVSRWLD